MRIGIYNHQHMVGSCPICRQTYVQGMIADAQKCQAKALSIYGQDCEFFNYTDLGDYPPDDTDRPGLGRLMEDVAAGNLDVVVCYTLNKISTDIDQLMMVYQTIRENNIEVITVADGKRAMAVMDRALENWKKSRT